jgi:Arm DNA-binding domain
VAAINTLSDKAIKSAIKAALATSKPGTISDGGGLSLQVQPSGAGWWRLRYWIGSRENRLSLGTYPEVSLADARQRRIDARALIAAGTDPSERRKAGKAAKAIQAEAARLADAGLPGPGTFEHVARVCSPSCTKSR